MRTYINNDWASILSKNGFDSFDALWNVELDWFEEPNERRGGWSGVCRMELTKEDGSKVGVFLKRQLNHLCKTFRHPLVGEPTLYRELRNIRRCQRADISVVESVVYLDDKGPEGYRALLLTEELTGYDSLESLTKAWDKEGWPPRFLRYRIIDAIADVIGRMHGKGFQFRCLLEKHIFVKITPSEEIDVCLIDLELLQKTLPKRAAIRDLNTFHREAPLWSVRDRVRFYKSYLKVMKLNSASKALWLAVEDRYYKKMKEKEAKHAVRFKEQGE